MQYTGNSAAFGARDLALNASGPLIHCVILDKANYITLIFSLLIHKINLIKTTCEIVMNITRENIISMMKNESICFSFLTCGVIFLYAVYSLFYYILYFILAVFTV